VHVDEAYKLQVAKTIDEVSSLSMVWEKFQWHPNASLSYFIGLVESNNRIERPHVVTVFENKSPKAMLVGRIETASFPVHVGYKVLVKPLLRCLTINYGGILGDVTAPCCDILISELTDCIKRKEADIVHLNGITVDSDLYKAAIKNPGLLCRDYFPSQFKHWQMVLPDNIDAVYQSLSGKRRHELRRRERQFLKDYSGNLKVKVLDKPDEVGQILEHAERIAKTTYHRALGVGFANNGETLQRILTLSRLGWLRAYILYVADDPCAFWIGTRFGEIFYLDYTGYDPKYKNHEPGAFLFMKMVEDLCKMGIKALDFGFGDALYKQRFGNKNWEEASVYIFSPTIRGAALNIAKSLAEGVSMLGNTFLHRMNALQKFKTMWRNRLRGNYADQKEQSNE